MNNVADVGEAASDDSDVQTMHNNMQAALEASNAIVPLIDLCIEAILAGGLWKYQRRSLERLPSPFAEKVFHRLLNSRQLSPPLLELFQSCLEDVNLSGLAVVDASWLAYVGAYTHLRSLNLSACKNVTDASLWHLLGLSELKSLNLARCPRVTSAGLRHILAMLTLESLDITETAVSPSGIEQLAALDALTELHVGGIGITRETLQRLEPLSKLRVLHAWGSALTNDGAALLPHLFPNLETLSLAWTDVTRVPDFPLLTSLDMSQCTVDSLFQSPSGSASAKLLRELILAGANLHHPADWPKLPYLLTLDLSGGKAHPDYFFCGRFSSTLTSLNLSSTPAKDSVWGLVSLAQGGGSVVPLRRLRLEGGKGLDEEELSLRSDVLLSGKLANLEELSVTGWDSGDRNWASVAEALPQLRNLTLHASSDQGLPATAVSALALLPNLENLSVGGITSDDVVAQIAEHAGRLRSLALKGDSIGDSALESLATMRHLRSLSVEGGVVTDAGVLPLAEMRGLENLELSGCWLLTSEGLADLRARFLERRGVRGRPIRIGHERLLRKEGVSDGKKALQPSKGSSSKSLDSNVWFGVGPGGSRSPGQFRKAAGGEQAQKQKPAEKGRRRSEIASRSQSVDERIRYDRNELLSLQRVGTSGPPQQLPALICQGTSSTK